MVKTAILGASGYTGVELVKLVCAHPHLSLRTLAVSEHSKDANTPISDIHPQLSHVTRLTLTPTDENTLLSIAKNHDVVLLATPHEASHDWVPTLIEHGAAVFDLSGAYRLASSNDYSTYYGFEHQHNTWLDKAVYGLAEHNAQHIQTAQLVAVPGCYPTASLSGLLPLKHAGLLDDTSPPVINAVSGVTGAGRKASLTTSFCEVSLQAYGVFTHRHTPEIARYLEQDVIFTPHLGGFKRGILATITAKLNTGVTADLVDNAFQSHYSDQPLIRLLPSNPRIDDVANTPFCDLAWHVNKDTGYVIVSSAIDNLLKGAASQAIQCVNLQQGWPQQTGLVSA